jgi:two-component system sensor histidine kinase KdpD
MPTRSSRGSAIRVAASLGIVVSITVFYFETNFANNTSVALTYLLAVLAIAAGWGLLEAIIASLAATLCFNYYFLPPVGTFTIADPQNWVALFTFLVVSIVASQLSERARRKAREAIEHQQETERLYTLSRMILLLGGNTQQVAREITHQIAQVFQAGGVTFFERGSGQLFRSGLRDVPLDESKLKEAAGQGSFVHDSATGTTVLPVSLGGKPIGSLAFLGLSLSDGALHAMANLVAIALESARSRELTSRAELARQSEEFKSTLLDTLAHELKTPLTSIKAAITSVLEEKRSFSEEHQELLTIVDEETDRLSRLVTEAIQTARIEAGNVQLHRGAHRLGEIIEQTAKQFHILLEGREVQLQIRDDLPAIYADVELIQVVLKQLLDNAAKYSPPGSPITVTALPRDRHVVVTVEDRGPGIPEEEQTRVFDKFFRGAAARESMPGVGMGLSIARGIVTAHGGRIWVDSVPGQGSRFRFTLTVAEQDRQP